MPCFFFTLALVAALSFVPVVQAQESATLPGPAGSSAEILASPGAPEIVSRMAPSVVQVLQVQAGAFEDSTGEGRARASLSQEASSAVITSSAMLIR